MAQPNGLQLIYSTEKPIADVVFVHGLFGHPRETWTSQSTKPGNTPAPVDTKATNKTADKRRSWLSSKLPFHRRTERRKAPQTGDEHVVGRMQTPARGLFDAAEDVDANNHCQISGEELFWPKDLLPNVIPDTQIYIWGYDVDINHIFSSASQATVFQHATNLLLDLANERTSAEARYRPLIFVAHSLGGIVVKDMLNASRNEVTHLRYILPATYGIIFLGTPHRGSSVATLGKVVQEITKVLWKSPNISVLRDLEVNSQTLERVSRGFNQILVERQLELQSFREELPTNGVMVVDSFSSCIENGRELLGTIPANHRNITKFTSALDVGFIRIAATLSRWVDEIKIKRAAMVSDSQGNIIREFDDKLEKLKLWIRPKNFKAQLAELLEQSMLVRNRAIFKNPDVKTWLGSHGSILNITSSTGYGKTTFAATLIEKITSRLPDASFVAFAFCRGITPSLILRSLIWQLVQNRSVTQQQRKQLILGYQEHSSSVKLDELTEDEEAVVFRELYERILYHYGQVTFVLDAVDQSESAESLIRHISFVLGPLLNSSVQCRVLFTSQQAIQWPETMRHGLSYVVSHITQDDMTHDTITFVNLFTESLQSPMNEAEKSRVLFMCLQESYSGWPHVMHTMATEYMLRERNNEARKIEEHVLGYRRTRFPEEGMSTIECKRILAVAMARQGHQEEAEKLQRHLLDTWRRVKGPNDDLCCTLMNDLSLTLMAEEKWEEANELQLQVVHIWEQAGDGTSSKLLNAMNNLALTYFGLKELDKAEDLFRRCLERLIKAHEEDHEIVLDVKASLGHVLASKGRWAEAEELEVSVMEERIRTLGVNNLRTLRSMSNVAWGFQQQGRYEKAKELQLQVVAGRTRLQGPNHPDTIGICGNLSESLYNLKEYDEARKYGRIALGL